jgi:ERCC4-related helicase
MKFQKFNEYVNEATITYTDKYADLTLSILQTMAQNKMLHWGTSSYAQHKTFCDFMEEFDALGDSLIESIMGKFGRPLTGGASIEVLDYNQVDVIAYFDNLYEYYTAAIAQFQPKEQNEEIVNILAEIIALIDKAKYLLTLNESEFLEYLSKLNEASNNEDDRVLSFLKRIAKDFDYPVAHAANFVKSAIKRLGY